MITVTHLSKQYGAVRALDDVSFDVRPGRVVGFVGPNGAGKTTAMRIMTGLTPASAGAATVLGRAYHSLPNPARHVGVLLDASAQHDGRTGREVLRLGALAMGMPRSRVDEMLALVGLTEVEAKRRVGKYSLGMRQRLGIAHALLGDPSVLILDEPANGLDPQGIHWMRGLLRDFADHGGTVLLSSHLLGEVQAIADELVVIGRGRVVAAGRLDELLAAQGSIVRATDETALTHALVGAGFTAVPRHGGGLGTDASPSEVGRIALDNSLVLLEVRAAEADLESFFLDLTADDARDGGVLPTSTKVA